MVASAPRYADALVEAIHRLDDGRLPLAELARRVGREAEALGLVRPSYVHVRRLAQAERERRRAQRELLSDAVTVFAAGRVPDLVRLAVDLGETARPRTG